MIDAIGLTNFKAFGRAEVSLKPLTLLSGVNGSGKSTILQSLGVLRQSAEVGCLRDGLLLNGELVELGTGKDVLFEYASSQEIGISVRRGGETASFSFRYGERDDLLETTQHPDLEGFGRCSIFDGSMQFLRADRVSPADVYPRSYTQAVRRRFLGVRGQYAAHFLAVHQDEQVAEGRKRAGKAAGGALLDQVNAWLAEMSPGVAVDAKELAGADLAQLGFTFGGKAGLRSSNEYRPTNVGFGLTYSLPIIVACLIARPGDLLLIENPEAHLHPRGQAVMAELLCQVAKDGVQVVFETHSDHVLNGVRVLVKRGLIAPEEVALHYCEVTSNGEGSRLHSPRVSPDGRLSSWPSGFFDEWERALLELV